MYVSNVELGSSQFQFDIFSSDRSYRVGPGGHQIAVRIYLAPGAHDIIAERWDVTIYDSDTFDRLMSIALPEQRASLQSEQAFTWAFDVPAFTQ